MGIGQLSHPLLYGAIACSVLGTMQSIAIAQSSPRPTPQPVATLLQEQGSLDQGDTVLPSDGSLYDSYTFQGCVGQQVTITLESSEFDTYLILLDSNDAVINQNDDISSDNTNSSFEVTLPVNGTYTVIANSYDNTGRGRYSLVVRDSTDSSTAIACQGL